MTWRSKQFLKSLLDNAWHLKAPDNIGVGTVEMCIDQGFIITKRVERQKKNSIESYCIAFRITRLGKAALKQ